MTSLYGISYYGIEQHITLTLPAWRCLFTVRDYMTLFNTTVCMRAVGVVVCLSLRMAKDRGSPSWDICDLRLQSAVSDIFQKWHYGWKEKNDYYETIFIIPSLWW